MLAERDEILTTDPVPTVSTIWRAANLVSVNGAVTLKAKVRLANGREVTALEIQTEYLEKALKYRDLKGLGPDESRALDMWAEVIDQLWVDPSVLFDKCDWVAKHRIVEEYQAKHGVALNSPKLAMIDLMYHDTDRTRGLYYRLERNGMMQRTTTDEAIANAQVNPPETTRARLRGAFVKRAKERRRDYTVDWVHLKLNDQAQRTVMLKDPFISHDDRVERLIASL